jgi:pyruvate ferredoxin oxidoreductase delta subunit
VVSKRCFNLTLLNSKDVPIAGKITKAGNSTEYHTGSWRSMKPVRDLKKCTNCLICWMYCPEGCILVKNGKIQKYDYDYCKGCGICATECPFKAIVMVDEDAKDSPKPEKFERPEA